MTVTPVADSNPQYQYIPVPNEHVPAVLAFLGSLVANVTTDSVATPEVVPGSGVTESEKVDGWTDAQLIRFATLPTKTSKIVVQMLDVLIERPGKAGALSTRQLADAIGVDYSVMKALPTQVTRMRDKHFPGQNRPYWGLWGTRDFSPSRTDEMYFAVTPERAEQWKRIRSTVNDA